VDVGEGAKVIAPVVTACAAVAARANSYTGEPCFTASIATLVQTGRSRKVCRMPAVNRSICSELQIRCRRSLPTQAQHAIDAPLVDADSAQLTKKNFNFESFQ
jgi:hypothetical protein